MAEKSEGESGWIVTNDLPEVVEEKALAFVQGCKEHGLIGIVILLDGSAEMTVIAPGLSEENVQEVLAVIAGAGAEREAVVKREYGARLDTEAMA